MSIYQSQKSKHRLDQAMARKGYQMVRYADDFVVCARTANESPQGLGGDSAVGQDSRSDRSIRPRRGSSTRRKKAEFDFLGYHFEQHREGGGKRKWAPGKEPAKAAGELARQAVTRTQREHPANRGRNSIRRSKRWYGYFKYSLPSAMQRVDEWVRERSRHIIRRRAQATARHGSRTGTHRISECLVCSARTVQAKSGPSAMASIRIGNH